MSVVGNMKLAVHSEVVSVHVLLLVHCSYAREAAAHVEDFRSSRYAEVPKHEASVHAAC